jgi:hypothetical protein
MAMRAVPSSGASLYVMSTNACSAVQSTQRPGAAEMRWNPSLAVVAGLSAFRLLIAARVGKSTTVSRRVTLQAVGPAH